MSFGYAFFILFACVCAVAYHAASAQITVCGKLEQYWFQTVVVEFSVVVYYAIVGIRVDDAANKVLKAVTFVHVFHLAHHAQRRLVYYGRSFSSRYASEQAALGSMLSETMFTDSRPFSFIPLFI